jgi:hypothetical protein
MKSAGDLQLLTSQNGLHFVSFFFYTARRKGVEWEGVDSVRPTTQNMEQK